MGKADHFWRQTSLRLVSSASRAEQISIWAMRLWWRAFPELDSAWPDLVSGFRACGVPAAIESFHRFCSAVLAAAGCGSGLGCLDCPEITATEERLLEAFASARSGDAGAVEAHLRQVFAGKAARLAAPHAVCFAQILACAGLQWPDQPLAEDRRYARFFFSAAPLNSRRFH